MPAINKIIIHDPKTFNSLDTLTNKNVVVIKYIKEGNMALQSMTVGCYYVAEIETYGGDTYYKLLTRNNFSTTYKDYIKVTKSIPNVVRFEEYPIDTWGEHNNYLKSDTLLYPGIKVNSGYFDLQISSGSIQRNTELFMNQVTRRLRPASGEIFKDCSYIYNTLKNNAVLYDGLKTLYKNSSGKIHQYFNDNKIYISTDINVSKFVSPGVYIDEPHRESEDELKAKAAKIKSVRKANFDDDEDDFWDDLPKPKKRISHPINEHTITGWGELPKSSDVIVANMDIKTNPYAKIGGWMTLPVGGYENREVDGSIGYYDKTGKLLYLHKSPTYIAGFDIASLDLDSKDRNTTITCIKPSPHQVHVLGASGGIEPLYPNAYERQKIYDATRKESEEDQERRILNANIPVKKHKFDETIGLTDDYLLIL